MYFQKNSFLCVKLSRREERTTRGERDRSRGSLDLKKKIATISRGGFSLFAWICLRAGCVAPLRLRFTPNSRTIANVNRSQRLDRVGKIAEHAVAASFHPHPEPHLSEMPRAYVSGHQTTDSKSSPPGRVDAFRAGSDRPTLPAARIKSRRHAMSADCDGRGRGI